TSSPLLSAHKSPLLCSHCKSQTYSTAQVRKDSHTHTHSTHTTLCLFCLLCILLGCSLSVSHTLTHTHRLSEDLTRHVKTHTHTHTAHTHHSVCFVFCVSYSVALCLSLTLSHTHTD